MELLTPIGLTALGIAPFIVALYFLRRRHPPRVVASLQLWSEARIAVLRGRPWERFRPTALLWLQLLALAAIAVALGHPACVEDGTRGERLVLVFDASASMGATDGSPTRWADAISAAKSTIDGSPSGSEAALLVAGLDAAVAEPFTSDRGKLKKRLDQLAVEGPDDGPGSLQEALLLAFQLGGSESDRRIVLLTDGAFDHEKLPTLPPDMLDVVVFGTQSTNLAITTFELRRAPNQAFEGTAIVTVENTCDTDLSGHLEITLDDTLLEAHQVQLAARSARTFSVPYHADTGRFIARLKDVDRDLLPADNVAYAVLSVPRPIRVAFDNTSGLVERALQNHDRLQRAAPDEIPDVIIYERNFPSHTPLNGRFLAIDPPEGNPLLRRGDPVQRPSIATWDAGHPVLHHVDLSTVRFADVRSIETLTPLVPLAEFAGEGGPAILIGQTPSWRAVVIPFSLVKTDLPLKVAFPVLLYNAIGWLAPGAETSSRNISTGTVFDIPAHPGSQIVVRTPKGETTTTIVDNRTSDGAFQYGPTSQAGFYDITVTREGERERGAWAASIANPQESIIAPRRRLSRPRGAPIQATESVQRTRSMIPAVLLLLLCIVGAEWWMYIRRNTRDREVHR